MRKLILSVLLCGTYCYAGQITHTDYTAGSVITAAGQNANENTIVNEINGNLDSTNISASGVATSNIADNAVTYGKLATIVQSTFTLVNSMLLHRKPNLQYINTTTVDIEANTGTSNETCITFIDEDRCVTENTGSTSQYRRLIVSETASMSGTHNSGILSGETLTANSNLAIYAVKTSDNASKYVLVASTQAPIQANYSTLNSKLGTNSWVYMGTVRYGDNGVATTSILKFVQVGPRTRLYYVSNNNFTRELGWELTGAVGVTASTWTYTSGMIGSNTMPSYWTMVSFAAYTASDTAISYATTSDGTILYTDWVNVAGSGSRRYFEDANPTLGFATSGASNITRACAVVGWYDPIVANSPAPRL